MIHSITLSQITGAHSWLRFEHLQFAAAHKRRGALSALLALSEEQRAREAQARMARLRGEADPVDTPEPEPDSAARHRLLPDIDEINDTLRGETAAAGAAAAATVAGAEAARRGGFRRGFITVVVIAVLAAVLYLLAPMLAERFPTLAPPLAAYTDWVDGIRLWLDLKLQGLMSGDAATAD